VNKEKNNLKQIFKILIILTIFLFVLFQYYPEKTSKSLNISWSYGLKMMSILPAVLILMGLVDVWIPNKSIKKYLGKDSGIKGILISILMGTLPTGPMYIAFPIAAELLKKEAGLKNIIIFLGVWASLKIPQIGVEIQFLGLKFAALRFIFTLFSIVFIGIIIEFLNISEEKSIFNLKKISKEKLRLVSELFFLLIFIGLFWQKELQRWILIFGFGVLISLIFNRIYCGWVCPMATIFRPINWIYKRLEIKRLKSPKFFQHTWVRWLILIFFIVTMICLQIFKIKLNLLLYIILLSLIITLIFEEEFWHKGICPYGTILSLFSQSAKYGLNIDEKKCISCGLCKKNCPNKTIDIRENNRYLINNKECLNCFKCQDVCPVDAINYGRLAED
jgi:ferredoxin-type protein NapH